MSIYKIYNTQCLESLFQGFQETLIWSCLEGIMGTAYADDIKNPKSAQIIVADFCFFAGELNKELLMNKPSNYKSNFIIMIPSDISWGNFIEENYKEKLRKVKRYALKKEINVFNIKLLKSIVKNLEKPFEIRDIDETIFNQIVNNKWSKDLCSQFKNYKDYKKRGIGVAIMLDNIIVSGASSYSIYNKGIEIEIDTKKEYRRRGLASVCGAKLILKCLNKGLYPSWDAQNLWSLSLAKKLGYNFDKEYIAYEINNY